MAYSVYLLWSRKEQHQHEILRSGWQFNERSTGKNDPGLVSEEIIRYHKKGLQGLKNTAQFFSKCWTVEKELEKAKKLSAKKLWWSTYAFKVVIYDH
jgi:hypothetical protein